MKKFMKMNKKLTEWLVISAVIFWVLPCLTGIITTLFDFSQVDIFVIVICGYVDTVAFLYIGFVSGIWSDKLEFLPFFSYAMYIIGVCIYYVACGWNEMIYFGKAWRYSLLGFWMHFMLLCIGFGAGMFVGSLARQIKEKFGDNKSS